MTTDTASFAQKIVSPVSSTVLQVQKTRLTGKIFHSHRKGNFYYTQIVSPALDEYSNPSRFGLRSSSKLGDIEQVITVDIAISGSSRPFDYTDKETGERKKGFDNTVYFDVVD